MTGTPIQNSMLDLYSLLKFLKFHPLSEKQLFIYLFSLSKDMIQSEVEKRRTKCWNLFLSEFLLLRRTKTDIPILNLPNKNFYVVDIDLNYEERCIYDHVFKETQKRVRELLKNQRTKVLYR